MDTWAVFYRVYSWYRSFPNFLPIPFLLYLSLFLLFFSSLSPSILLFSFSILSWEFLYCMFHLFRVNCNDVYNVEYLDWFYRFYKMVLMFSLLSSCPLLSPFLSLSLSLLLSHFLPLFSSILLSSLTMLSWEFYYCMLLVPSQYFKFKKIFFSWHIPLFSLLIFLNPVLCILIFFFIGLSVCAWFSYCTAREPFFDVIVMMYTYCLYVLFAIFIDNSLVIWYFNLCNLCIYSLLLFYYVYLI